MDPFAKISDYTARFGEVSDTGLLAECLDDASAVMRARLDAAGVDYSEPTEDYADRLMRVCRSMANRIYPSGEDAIPAGATQASITAGPYSQQFTFGGAYGTPKLLASELALLGIGGSKGRMLHPRAGITGRGCRHDTWHDHHRP